MARELIARADVVVENFSSGIMKKYGLDYASVAPANPRMVYCSISAYGREGPFASRPGFDPITQAESGFMSLNGFPDGPPVRTGYPVVDMATGMRPATPSCWRCWPATGSAAVSMSRSRCSTSRSVMTGFYGMTYLMTGVNQTRFGNSPNGSPTVGVYEAADGPFYMACANDRLVRRLMTDVLGPVRSDQAIPCSPAARARSVNKDKLRAILEWDLCRRQTR